MSDTTSITILVDLLRGITIGVDSVAVDANSRRFLELCDKEEDGFREQLFLLDKQKEELEKNVLRVRFLKSLCHPASSSSKYIGEISGCGH